MEGLPLGVMKKMFFYIYGKRKIEYLDDLKEISIHIL